MVSLVILSIRLNLAVLLGIFDVLPLKPEV